MELAIQRRKRSSNELNVAPLVDVVFLLLIFFLLTNSFLKKEDIPISLPESSNAQSSDDSQLEVTLKGSEIFWEGEVLTLEDLESRLLSSKKGDSGATLLIRADAASSVQDLISVIDIARSAGIEDVGVESSKGGKG